MEVLIVERTKINASVDKFYRGSASIACINGALSAAKRFEEMGDVILMHEVFDVRTEHGVLFPHTFAVQFCRGKPGWTSVFAEHFPLLEREAKRITDFTGSSLNETMHSFIRRALLMVHITTTVEKLSELTEDVWAAWVSIIKEADTQYKIGLRLKPQDIRALRVLAAYMDAHYPTAVGYLQRLNVRRKSNISDKTGKDKAFVENPPKAFKAWADIFDEYKLVRKLKNSKLPNSAFRLLGSWLEQYPEGAYKEPHLFLSKERSSPSLMTHAKNVKGEALSSSARWEVRFLNDMVDYYIEQNMAVLDDDERTILGYSILSRHEKQNIFSQKSSSAISRTETSSNPLPLRWVREVQRILTENDWEWPKSQESQWITLLHDGRPKRIWNPVCAYLIYSMTELPWRKIQFKSLDSGEGDKQRYDLANECWVPNTGLASGYWERDQLNRNKARGVLNRQGGDFCFYVNTNKTSDRKHDHGEMSGYHVPWKYMPMIELFSELRDWQETYNPLKLPTSYADVSAAFYGPDVPSKNVEDNIPARFYLFRDVQGKENRLGPPSDNRLYALWRLLMDELEKRLKTKGDDATIILKRNKSGGPMVSHFHLHGLRVSGLTAFAEAGVPIEVLSKLVAGHASILMTIYYLKYSAAHVTDILSDARLKVEAIAAKDFGRYLRSQTIENAMAVAVANEIYTLEGISDGQISIDQFFDTGLGVCPYNGTRCDDGVALTGGRTSPVPGYAKNCLLCRHFVTGEPWLLPLILKQQKFSGHAADLAKSLRESECELEQNEGRRAEIIREFDVAAVPPDLTRKIRHLEHEIERQSLDLDCLLSTMNRTHLIIEQIKALQATNQDAQSILLLSDTPSGAEAYREGTRFELIDTVLQASRVYPILQDEGFEQERRSYIDAIMFNNGMRPLSLSSLTEDQKHKAADAAGKWLLTKVGAQQTELLISGAQTLEELGFKANEFSLKVKMSANQHDAIEASD